MLIVNIVEHFTIGAQLQGLGVPNSVVHMLQAYNGMRYLMEDGVFDAG